MKKLWGLVKSALNKLIDNLVRESLERNKDILKTIRKGGYV